MAVGAQVRTLLSRAVLPELGEAALRKLPTTRQVSLLCMARFAQSYSNLSFNT